MAIVGRHHDGVDAIAVGTTHRRRSRGGAGDHTGGADGQAWGQTRGRVSQRVGGVGVREGARHIHGRDRHAVGAALVGDRAHGGGGVVQTRHGDRDGGCGGAAIAIADEVGNRGGGGLTHSQVLKRGAWGEGVAAIGIHGERATIGAGHRRGRASDHCGATNRGDRQRIEIGVGVIAKHIAARSAHARGVVLIDVQGVVGCRGRRVAHRPGKGLGGGAAMAVIGGHGDGVDTAVAGATHRSVVIGGAGDDARRADRQAWGQARGCVGQRVVIDVREGARHAYRSDG